MTNRAFATLVIAVSLFASAAFGAQADAPATSPASAVVKPPAKETFHIYLLMGQSNMVGRDTRGMDQQADNPRILSLNTDGQWVVARDPLHPQVGRIPCGVGPGLSFATEMLNADPGMTIGLVPCAVGGTPLRRWVKGGDLYENAVKRANLASQTGTLEGVLWHQGESDSEKEKDAKSYEARLTQMFKDLRHDLGSPNLPIVVGQLGEFLSPEKFPYVDVVRAVLKQMPAMLPHVGYADSTGLGDKGDKIHFTAAAQREFGVRYAKAMKQLQALAQTTQPVASVTVDVWPEGKMPGHGATDPEQDRPSKGDNVRRITNISRPTLSVFPAPGRNTPAPAIIVCPGGGYSYVVFDKEGTEIARWLNSGGIAAIVLKYRTPHNRDGAFQDVQRAISVARAHAPEWKIDPNRLGVIGFSAGGNLAAKASTDFDQHSYVPIDSVDQQSCRPNFAILVYPAYLAQKDGTVSPDLNLKAKVPPTLIVHSEDDKTFIAGSKAYHAALDQANVPNKFLLYPTGGHGYGLRCTRDAKAWPQAALQWLQERGNR